MSSRPRQLSGLEDHRNSWQVFIEAQEAVVRHRERPLKIKLPEEENFSSSEVRLEIIPTDNKAKFYQQAKSLLGLQESAIDARLGYFSLPWNTAATTNNFLKLAEVAEQCYFSYQPQPVLQGSVRKRRHTPEAVKQQVELLLNRAELARPFQVDQSKAAEDSQIKVSIRLLGIAETPESTNGERNFLRWTRAEAALAMRQTLTAAGFVWQGVKATLCTVTEPEKTWTLNADEYSHATLLAYLEELKRGVGVQIQDLVYCFRTTSGNKTEQASCLEALAGRLKAAFPNIKLEADLEWRQLTFTHYFSFAKRVSENLRLHNLLDSFRPELERLQLALQLPPQDRLVFRAKEEPQRFVKDEAERLQQLRGEEITIGEGPARLPLGQLVRVKYPFIYIGLPPECTDEHRDSLLTRLRAAGEVRPNLTGDREKLYRLSQALRRVNNPEAALPNPQTRRALFDSTAAGGAANPGELEPDSATWREVATHSYLPLNPAQHAAVVASLLTPDLALVQGPPGTGKSTAISQIIWHLVRQNPQHRILLTSETNTAVDNALEKLEHGTHNLVRPVRIGDESKLEREGGRYALSRLTAWAENSVDDLTAEQQDNALTRWLRNIARRAEVQAPAELPAELREAWVVALASPSATTKSSVLSRYLAHTNVIGATGGALGEKTTRQTPTQFFRQYQRVFGSKLCVTDKTKQLIQEQQYIKAERFGLANLLPPKSVPRGIRFDVVVMDEASKATPPELALALIHAHRAVVIGDHRQLPPLLDQEEFRNTLEAAGAPELARQFSRADAETSQFERLFTQPGLQPGVLSRFDTQYRMHPDINEVIKQFYVADGGLNCGIPTTLADVPDLSHPLSRYHGLSHPALLTPADHLVWVEVDAPEMLAGTSRVNPTEVEAVRAVLSCLAGSQGFADFQRHWTKPEDQEVALITFYGRQVRLLKEVEAEFASRVPTRLQTVDKFQGMERNIVVVSLVRSDMLAYAHPSTPDLDTYPDSYGYPPQPSLGFAQFPNRLNVALSRAKRLLVIVGNSRHFSRHDCYRRVYETVQARGRVVPYTDLLPYLSA
ncbi:hypothetical protein EU557_13490 [Hymenobacter wooponensis]|uniref:AAA+ ATPase domain-containing protein n=1 Tax=Hymenobacter wooponensis TaxID=1525360 RepID=A0A4Z0MMJ5_9BACT|nr:hypothetical protein EU557_13490 [Hymenobacter wooponensis]